MAKVEPVDVRNSLGASLGGVQTDVGADRVAAGMTLLGGALDRLGEDTNRAVAIVARGYNQRANERVYLEGQQDYWSFESDLLRGKDGVLLRRAEDFEGAALETTQKLNDHAREYASKMKTGPGRDAFIEFATKEIARTRDQVAAEEAGQLEDLRVSRAGAAISTRMQKTVIEAPERFLPRTRPDGTTSYADPDLIKETEQNLEMMHRGMSDEETAVQTRNLIAENAYKSVFAQLDLSPNRIPVARKIQEAYESMWSPTERAAVTKRIVDEGAYSSMDGIVSGSYSAVLASDSTPSEKALRDHAASVFKSDFKARNGYEAPDDMVQEVKRRASVDLGLRLDSDKQAHDDLRGAQQTNVIKLLAKGDTAAVSAEVTRLLEGAHGERDTQFAGWLLQVQTNMGKTGTGFPAESTPKAKDRLYQPTDGMSRSEIMYWKPFMKESDFTAWAGPALGMKGSVPEPKVIGEALDAARVRVDGKGPYEKTPAKDVRGSYAKKYQQMLDLSQDFFRLNEKLPDRIELERMATSLHLSYDDQWHSGGFDGTLGELFTADPEEVSFDLAQKKDQGLIATALEIGMNHPSLVVDGRRFPLDSTPESLSRDPAMVIHLLRFGLLTNAPLTPIVDGLEPRRFRDDTAEKAVAK